MQKLVLVFLVLVAACLPACAQGNELAGVVGVKFTPSTSSALSGTTSVDTAFAIEGSFAHQLKSFSVMSLQLELPVMVTPSANVNTSNLFASKNYTALYFTPGIKLKFAPGSSLSPWISVGGGLARFNPSSTSVSGGASPATSTVKGAAAGGAGLDFKASFLPITFRVEAREYFSGAPNLNIPRLSLHNNIFAGAGLVLNF